MTTLHSNVYQENKLSEWILTQFKEDWLHF